MCYTRSVVDRDFGHWLAGFIDGEGCFYITRDNQRAVYRARFSLSLRSDDRPILDEARDRTGLGRVHNYKGQNANQVSRWMIQSRADTEALVALLDRFPLRAKKRNDYAIWREAVFCQRAIRAGRSDNSEVASEMDRLKKELALERQKGIVYLYD